MKKCILLTATIVPSNVPNLKRTNKEQREEDYIEAIKYYIQYNIPIVFCENSNTRSKVILDLLSKSKIDFEYLTLKTQKSTEGKGKGEAEILSFAFSNSSLVKESTHIIKITGRYRVKYFLEQLKKIKKDTIYINITQNLTYSDSRFFIINNNFYHNFYSVNFNKIDERKGVFMEHVLLISTLKYISDFNKWSLLNRKNIYAGVYGTDDKTYKNNLFKLFAKNILFGLKKYFFRSNL